MVKRGLNCVQRFFEPNRELPPGLLSFREASLFWYDEDCLPRLPSSSSYSVVFSLPERLSLPRSGTLSLPFPTTGR